MTKISTKQWNEFDKKISTLVISAMQHCNLTQVDLAEKIGMSQSNISCLLNLDRKRRDRHWTIPNLLRLAELFGTTIYHLMYEAEKSEGNVPLFFATAGTEPFSRERLQTLIHSAVVYKEENDPRGTTRKAYSLLAVEADVPEFCEDYYARKFSDMQAVTYFQKANRAFMDPKYSDRLTFGRAVKLIYLGELDLLG
jgi:transcriptional regulator with XRE-family HTH domain